MKVTHNDDGTVTVRVPKAPEVYEPADGELYVEETIPADEFKKAIAKPKKGDQPED